MTTLIVTVVCRCVFQKKEREKNKKNNFLSFFLFFIFYFIFHDKVSFWYIISTVSWCPSGCRNARRGAGPSFSVLAAR